VTQEFGNPSKHIAGVALASQVGLLVGAAFWGFSADIIGRKTAFNSSLFICAAFVLIAGAMPNYISFCAMLAISNPSALLAHTDPRAGLPFTRLAQVAIISWMRPT
jgi:MFS family permease